MSTFKSNDVVGIWLFPVVFGFVAVSLFYLESLKPKFALERFLKRSVRVSAPVPKATFGLDGDVYAGSYYQRTQLFLVSKLPNLEFLVY